MSEKVNWNNISRARKANIANAINNFGDGAHPMASATNLDYFDMTYLMNCLMSGVETSQKALRKARNR